MLKVQGNFRVQQKGHAKNPKKKGPEGPFVALPAD